MPATSEIFLTMLCSVGFEFFGKGIQHIAYKTHRCVGYGQKFLNRTHKCVGYGLDVVYVAPKGIRCGYNLWCPHPRYCFTGVQNAQKFRVGY